MYLSMMNTTIKNIWMTINILLAAAMILFVVTKGVSHSTTLLFIGLTNLSALLYMVLNRRKTS